ncbi:hypothetical protein Rhopal_004742-T1 [Rhodotorula paludigena]|uniref:GPI ethanolamine phosphate transferase 1 n=1 Tax=Rhodotorula paludigena TaxID=86838 RepID=A0AAV5GMK4_9BASI|nr:hypothetical protein Rhopal_004742-T1 [Rhodotorula paludigena]
MADARVQRAQEHLRARTGRSALQLLVISLIFHACALPSIFDIYFRSPVVQVPERFAPDTQRLAKRVVLISGQAQWGVSHTRVPTESRPGHVALIGGMYEDVSAVTRGWTTNPVPFDSVFNQSSHAFTFGSPDILPMFQLGASDPDRVAAFSYEEEAEDFTADAVHLDLWVLDQLKALLSNATRDPALDAKLRQPGVVFFEHLLGLDTTGHSYRPHGPEYHRNIRVVDHVVRETSKLLTDFYGDDGETAFVFTADHGMSTVGNHGDGNPENTRTPLVVWGKGVKRQQDWEEPGEHDEYSKDWGLRGVRRDVEQADVASLMSVLAGIPFPANSAGRVPLDYLDVSPASRARIAFANAKQLLAEAEAKAELKKRHALAFRPFSEFETASPSARRENIQRLLDSGAYQSAEAASAELARVALRASDYIQKYDWLLLRTIVTLGYLGFMAFTIHTILAADTAARPHKPSILSAIPLLAFGTFVIRFAVERAPLSYYLYALFPSAFWTAVLRDPGPFVTLFRSAHAGTASPAKSILYGTVTLVAIEAMAYGYTDRVAFAAIALSMGLVWPAVMLDRAWKAQNRRLSIAWAASMSILAVFPILPVEKGEELRVVSPSSPTWPRARLYLVAEIALMLATLGVTWSSATSLQRKEGLPAINQFAGWILLGTASVIPLLHGRPRGQPYTERLAVLLFAFGPAFVILSLSYEALFYAVYCSALVAWMLVESSLASSDKDGAAVFNKGIRPAHVRVSLFFLAFLHLGFFGCGNVASISSFYLEPVYRLMTVFAPFPMGALLLFKLLIPFIALAAVSSVINRRLHLPPLSLFLVSSVLSEILTINFFFRVTDTGSWLEIGSSITNFVICSLLGLFSSVLLAGGEYLLAHSVG